MIYRLLCLLCASCWLACSAPAEPETSSITKLKTTSQGTQHLAVDRKPLPHVPINTSLFCRPESDRNCLQEAFNLETELLELNPLLLSPLEPPLSLAEADRRYRAFVARHTGEPILAVFRQVFPRVLFHHYELLLNHDYPRLTYYTQQLINAQSYDIATQARALTVLKPHLPASQFNQLLQAARENARRFRPVQARLFARRMASVSDLSTTPDVMSEQFVQQVKAQSIADTQAVDQAIGQLERMQTHIID